MDKSPEQNQDSKRSQNQPVIALPSSSSSDELGRKKPKKKSLVNIKPFQDRLNLVKK